MIRPVDFSHDGNIQDVCYFENRSLNQKYFKIIIYQLELIRNAIQKKFTKRRENSKRGGSAPKTKSQPFLVLS